MTRVQKKFFAPERRLDYQPLFGKMSPRSSPRRADLDNCLAGRFFSLLVARFATLWIQKHLIKMHARRQRSGVNKINISTHLFLPGN